VEGIWLVDGARRRVRASVDRRDQWVGPSRFRERRI
jgi:hypothetical protein